MNTAKQMIAIAGATGFVGGVLMREPLLNHSIIGLTRGSLPEVCSIVLGRQNGI